MLLVVDAWSYGLRLAKERQSIVRLSEDLMRPFPVCND